MEYKTSKLTRFILGRIAFSAVSALFVAVVVFFVIRSLPGDPARVVLGDSATPEQYVAMREIMGLDQPLIVQLWAWFSQMITGGWGHSFSQGRPVVEVVLPALGNSMLIGGIACVFAVLIALVLGNAATVNNRRVRRSADWVEATLLSAPQYTVALLLLVGFAVLLPVFPAGGLESRGGGGLIHHLILPALALALAPGAVLARALKTSILEIKGKDLIPSLTARGLSPAQVTLHVHHNALPPMVTMLGLQVGAMLGGALFIEQIFSIPGLGLVLVQSVGLRDYALVQAIAFTVALIAILAMLLADIVNATIDPRIRAAR